ncbi:MAG: hypothetical protein OMM_11723, partial [Candidatus Magnetoglobus multicellularis str. Araruama]
KESILVGEMKRMVAGMKKRYKMILVFALKFICLGVFLLLAKNTPRIWVIKQTNGKLFYQHGILTHENSKIVFFILTLEI